MQKPFFEQVTNLPNRSFFLRRERGPVLDMPFHYHPEIEITYNEGITGRKFIGNSVSSLHEHDLVFLGSNLPHAFISDEHYNQSATRSQSDTLVLQFKLDLFKDNLELPEFAKVHHLLQLSKQGLVFGHSTMDTAVDLLHQIVEAAELKAFILLIELLNLFAQAKDYKVLSSKGFIKEYHAPDYHRLNMVYNYIVEHFREELSLNDVAEVANMTEPAFCRFLKKRTTKTFTQIVSEMRISYACSLIKKDQYSFQQVAHEAGFNNLSHFNRQFKKITRLTPSEYHKAFSDNVLEEKSKIEA